MNDAGRRIVRSKDFVCNFFETAQCAQIVLIGRDAVRARIAAGLAN